MILKQRKRHKYIWLTIAMILPIAMFFAAKNVSFHQVEKKMPQLANKTNAMARATNKQLEIALVKTTNASYTLEIQLKEPLVSTSSLVYGLDATGNKGVLLGQLNGIGDYNFVSRKSVSGIVVHDAIKGNEILKLKF